MINYATEASFESYKCMKNMNLSPVGNAKCMSNVETIVFGLLDTN